METINVYSATFESENEENPHVNLAPVLKNSVQYHMPHAHFVQEWIPPLEEKDLYEGEKGKQGFAHNHWKLKYWKNFVLNSSGPVLLLDTDMLIRSNVEDVFKEEFDLGITYHTSEYYPFNAGVVFVQDTPEAKAFVKEWYNVDCQMFEDMVFHKKYQEKYAGMNQASLGYCLEQYPIKVKKLPSDQYNAYRQQEFSDLQEGYPKIVHLKSDLRRVYREKIIKPNNKHTPRTLLKKKLSEEVRSYLYPQTFQV